MAKNNSKKNRRSVSLLIVPDNYSEPINFKLSIRAIKIMVFGGIILTLHILVGGFFYYRYYVVHKENSRLIIKNAQLENENNKVVALAARAQEVENVLRKLKVSLGIEPGAYSDHLSDTGIQNVNQDDVQISQEEETSHSYEPLGRISDIPFRNVSNEPSTFHAVFDNYPTFLPVDGLISRTFDQAKFHEPLSRYRHLGIDIAAKKGSVIRAAGSGRIIFSGWTPDLGNLLIIYHGNDLFTYYAHNMRLLRENGNVKKGEPIALLGSSGKTSTAPHLHFEIWKDGQPIDPKEYIFSLQTPENVEKGL